MPLTKNGKRVLATLIKQYGAKKGEQVFSEFIEFLNARMKRGKAGILYAINKKGS